MLLSQSGRVASESQVSDFLRLAGVRRFNLTLLRISERRGRIIWSILPVLSPGHTALLLCPPVPAITSDHEIIGGMVDLCCQELAGQGVEMAQSLLDPEDVRSGTLLESRSFERMAELIYLSAEPRRRFIPPPLPAGMRWVQYDSRSHKAFSETIAATYEQSMDCPALNGRRNMEDVMAGHQASGEFVPALWRLLCEDPLPTTTEARPLGVLLLAPIPQASAVELVYLGLIPAARGRRLGDLLVKHALAGVAENAMNRLTLAVDARNAPALQLYYRNGLCRVGAKLAMMRDLRGMLQFRPA